jgi:hypothetical protein
MDSARATRLINQEFHLPPERMRLHAEDMGRGIVRLYLQFDSIDSTDYWVRTRRDTFTPEIDIPVYRAGTVLELSRLVLEAMAYVNSHEDREFLRIGPNMIAPFHPHNQEGNRSYELTQHLAGV